MADGVSQDMEMAWPARSGDVKGASGYHCSCYRGPVSGGGGPGVWGVAGVGVAAGGPVPGRGRGGVRAAVPAATSLPVRDQPGTVELIVRLRDDLCGVQETRSAGWRPVRK